MSIFTNLKIWQKLIGGFIIMAVIVGITGTFGIINLDRLGIRVVGMMQDEAAVEKVVLIMEQHQKSCRVNLVEGSLVRNDPAEFEKYVENYEKKKALFRESVDLLVKGDQKRHIPAAEAGGKRAQYAAAILASWEDFEEVAEQLIERKRTLLKGLTPGFTDQAALRALADDRLNELATKQIMEASETAKLDIDDMADYVESQMHAAIKSSADLRKTATTLFITVTLGAIVLAILLGTAITRWFTAGLRRISVALDEGANGNLAVRVAFYSDDELGKLGEDFNAMTGQLGQMVSRVSSISGDLTRMVGEFGSASRRVGEAAHLQMGGISTTSSAVTEINASLKMVTADVDALAQNADASASSIQEMAATVEEVALNTQKLNQSVENVSSSILQMVSAIREVGDSVGSLREMAEMTAAAVVEMDVAIGEIQNSATETAQLSLSVQQDAGSGKEAVQASIDGIHEIRDASSITFDVIEKLSLKATDIGSILSVIDEVAEQINLLALNAAIIAAQAGDHGKGFAVVAGEIKALAERTSVSTRQIAGVIKGVQDETDRAVAAIRRAEGRISAGESLSLQSGSVLVKIVDGAVQSSERMEQIALAATEQARASRMIRESMDQIAFMVGRIGTATQEQRQGGEQIGLATENMRDITGQVRMALQEQTIAAKSIASATDQISTMIQQIRRSCSEQARGSDQIVMAVSDIQNAAAVNIDVTSSLGAAADRLAIRAAELQHEIDRFVIAEHVDDTDFNAKGDAA